MERKELSANNKTLSLRRFKGVEHREVFPWKNSLNCLEKVESKKSLRRRIIAKKGFLLWTYASSGICNFSERKISQLVREFFLVVHVVINCAPTHDKEHCCIWRGKGG